MKRTYRGKTRPNAAWFDVNNTEQNPWYPKVGMLVEFASGRIALVGDVEVFRAGQWWEFKAYGGGSGGSDAGYYLAQCGSLKRTLDEDDPNGWWCGGEPDPDRVIVAWAWGVPLKYRRWL